MIFQASKLQKLFISYCEDRGFAHSRSIDSNSDICDSVFVIRWMNECYPCLPKILTEKLQQICFNQYDSHVFMAPELCDESSILSSLDVLPFACICDELQGNWRRLYTTDTDGRCFNRIVHHLIGYEGPMFIVIKCSSEPATILGAYVDSAFKDCNRYHGNRSNFLYTLSPDFNVYRTSGRENHYQWLNTKLFGLPHGMGFGGNREDGMRLFIPDSMEQCTARGTDLTYDPGPLLPKSSQSPTSAPTPGNLEIDSLEIWGTGGDEIISTAMSRRVEKRESINATIQQARKVDKSQFAGNSFDQEMFLSKNFSHKTRVAEDASVGR